MLTAFEQFTFNSMLTSDIPENWKALQDAVATILRECGMTVEVEKTIETARGRVEIDVYAEENIKGRRHRILFECKHWQGRVPQQIIHGFRTVVGDTGANAGYIVSLAGFQSGAFSASELTNIQLVSWEEFQEAFQGQWIEACMLPLLRQTIDALQVYSKPSWYDELSEFDRSEVKRVRIERAHLSLIVKMFCDDVRFLRRRAPQLPISGWNVHPNGWLPQDVVDLSGYRDFLHACIRHATANAKLDYGIRPSRTK